MFVLDNCPPTLHREASDAVKEVGGTVSVVTVEYDVREDVPPETNVLRLERSSDTLIRKMVMQHHPHIGEVDAERIVEFSDGNARIADALAATVQFGDTLSNFKDDELFQRLFHQRHSEDGDLQSSAEVLSLVYSYDGASISEGSELSILASITDTTSRRLYSDTAVLIDRKLVQTRSHWLAVLPHALSNRLAAIALRKSHPELVSEVFLSSGSERLIKSFSRRLGYLHDSTQVQEIVHNWLRPEGWIGENVASLNNLGLSALKNIAPVAPEETLAAIENAIRNDPDGEFTSPDNSRRMEFIHLLRSIAYDPAYFARCFDTLLAFSVREDGDGQATTNLAEMFWIILSGTHAAPHVRLQYIKGLIRHSDATYRKIGIRLLRASLKSEMFSSSHSFDFGARPRDHGLYPASIEMTQAWFGQFLGYATELALEDNDLKDEVRGVIASRIRGLWWIRGVLEKLEATALALHTDRPWGEGWIAIRQILKLDRSKEKDKDARKRLMALEEKLRPQNLVEKARTYAMGDANYDLEYLDEDDDEEAPSGYERANEIARDLGKDIANNEVALEELIPEMAANEGTRIGLFGEGVALGATDLRALWDKLCIVVRDVPPETRNISILLGFIGGYYSRDSEAAKAVLDNLVEDEDFAEAFPYFQTAAGVESSAVPRLLRSLDVGKAPIHSYFRLAIGRAHEGLSDSELIKLLRRIEQEDGGMEVVGDILKMRLWGTKEGAVSPELRQLSQQFFEVVPLKNSRRSNSLHDQDLKVIAKHAMYGQGGDQAAHIFCRRLIESDRADGVYLWNFPATLASIAKLQPRAFLDEFFGGLIERQGRNSSVFSRWFERRENPITFVPMGVLIEWCQESPDDRVDLVARDMIFFQKVKDKDGHRLEWRDIFDAMFEIAPDKRNYLDAVSSTLRPWSWSGHRSDVLRTRLALVESVRDHTDPVVQKWAKALCAELNSEIELEVVRERDEQEARDERFE
ncbi:hypothetical protein [Pacificispira sp.]|uniref:hypothetical protein n=1 Tax=Pacificispira sp. TaxID=2888761 RepID=UPI003B52F97D